MYSTRSLQDRLSVLSICNSRFFSGDEDGELTGPCTDNAVSSVGIILERMEGLKGQAVYVDINYAFIWNQWISYLPLKHDTVGLCCILEFLYDAVL
jgi:hypothetical protein